MSLDSNVSSLHLNVISLFGNKYYLKQWSFKGGVVFMPFIAIYGNLHLQVTLKINNQVLFA